MTDEPDLFSSRAGRDEGIERVSANNPEFMADALDMIGTLPLEWTGTGEDIREIVEGIGVRPKHPNAWGALINTAFRRRLIRKTGQWVPMRKRASHARSTPKYMRVM